MLAIAFSAFLGLGLFVPCLALRLDLELLHIPHGLMPLVDSLRLPEAARSNVSMWTCMQALFSWSCKGEVNCALALVLLAFFVFLLVIADMVVLAVLAKQTSTLDADDAEQVEGVRRSLRVSQMMRKLAMLDVLVAGVVVVFLCMFVYRKNGVVLNPDFGWLALLAAELCHYFQYRCVSADAEALLDGAVARCSSTSLLCVQGLEKRASSPGPPPAE